MSTSGKHITIESHGPGWQAKITNADTGEMLKGVTRVLIDIHPASAMAEATLTILQETGKPGKPYQMEMSTEDVTFHDVNLSIIAEARYWHTRLGELQKLRYLVQQARIIFAQLNEVYQRRTTRLDTGEIGYMAEQWMRKYAEIERGSEYQP